MLLIFVKKINGHMRLKRVKPEKLFQNRIALIIHGIKELAFLQNKLYLSIFLYKKTKLNVE